MATDDVERVIDQRVTAIRTGDRAPITEHRQAV